MPSSFRFPVNHQYWIPLRVQTTDFVRGAGPTVDVFERIVAGTSMYAARVEVEAIRQRLRFRTLTCVSACAHRCCRTRIRSSISKTPAWRGCIASSRAGHAALVVVGVNVAVLMYVRTASRLGEITVRTALGASRRRVVLQLFAESLVLSSTAAAIGLAAGSFALRWLGDLLRRELGGSLPFWFEPGLSPALVAYAAGLAVLAAVIVGVVPALRATCSRIQAGLRTRVTIAQDLPSTDRLIRIDGGREDGVEPQLRCFAPATAHAWSVTRTIVPFAARATANGTRVAAAADDCPFHRRADGERDNREQKRPRGRGCRSE